MIVRIICAYLESELLVRQGITHEQRTALICDPPTITLPESQCKMHPPQWARSVSSAWSEQALEFIVEKDRTKVSLQFLRHDLCDHFKRLIQVHRGITDAVNTL